MSKLKKIKLEGERDLLPLKEDVKIAAFAIIKSDDLENEVLFFRYLAQAFIADIDFGFINENITPHDIEAIKSGILESDVVIFLILFPSKSAQSLNNDLLPVLSDFSEKKKCIIVSNASLEILPANSSNLLLLLQDTSEKSLVSAIVELSGKSIGD